MKIVVAAKRVLPDKTSEGICSSKYVGLLVSGRHDVACVTGEPVGRRSGIPGVPGIPVTEIENVRVRGTASRLARFAGALAARGPVGAFVSRKADAVCAYSTGHSLQTWQSVDRWRAVLASVVGRERPDAIVTRGAGREFEPHMAMLDRRGGVPWVAHYHDPYPASLYPQPYRQRTLLLSSRQERIHRKIIAQANALTFPSQRLLEWVLTGDLERHRQKAFVVPHVASEPCTAASTDETDILQDGCLNILHTGTLLRERDPRGLLRGFLKFTGGQATMNARLVFVGRVDRRHSQTREWQALKKAGLLVVRETRVTYGSAIQLSRRADCLVVLEADASVSPFFPAKLADYLWLGKPVLAASPGESATTDLLGADYPLNCRPGDSERAAIIFERLWQAWRDRALDALVPASSIVRGISEAAVLERAGEALAFACGAPRTV